MRRRRESFAFAALLAGLCGVALALPAAGPAVTPVGPKPLVLSILSTSQQEIIAGGLNLRVEARRGGIVKLDSPVTDRVRLRFRKPGAKQVRLPLDSPGAALIGGCARQVLSVTGTLRGRRGGKARAGTEADLTRDLAACKTLSGGAPGGGSPPAPPDDDSPPGGMIAAPSTSSPDKPGGNCDFLDRAVCLQPWPNNYFATTDSGTATGLRLNLDDLSTPTNLTGVPLEASDYNHNDGFSPGSMLITRVPGLDNPEAFQNTGPVPITDMARYADPDQPIVVINADTGQRQPIWSEIDYNPIDPAKGGDANNPADRANVNLIIRPAVNFDEGGHYIVALRNLKDKDGNTIQPSDAFRVYRDNLTTTPQVAAINARRPHFENLFSKLRKAGIRRSNLYLAWDFTVASERNLSERALSIRDDAFAQLGDTNLADLTVQGNSPAFSISSVTNKAEADDDRIAREVTGTFTVPCYLFPTCQPGGRFVFQPGTELPTPNPATSYSANFTCEIPRSAIDPPTPNPTRPSLYGHGLLGDAGEVDAGNVKSMANEHNFTFCATDWSGFSFSDVPTVLLALQNLSVFPELVDRMQQGFVNQMYLGRLLLHANGFASNAAFQDDGQSVINPQRLFYDGNSQGGIMGGALTALSVDLNRSVLGVPAMNYSTLLTRSVDFEPYAEGVFTPEICDLLPDPLNDICNLAPSDSPFGLYDNYPNELERPLIFSLIQLLWDRGEADGYAHHMTTDPFPNTPAHSVLMHAAFGDHQVANVAAEVEARTIGAGIYQPALDPGRYWGVNGIFGLPAITSFPYGGSAMVYWDGGPTSVPGGSGTPPNENIPPRPSEGFGSDPHSYPRSDPKARIQKSAFLRVNGSLVNPCVNGSGQPTPCYSHGYTGP